MGIGKFIEGAPKRDPEFILPPEPEDQPLTNEELLRREKGISRSIKALFGVGALVVAGSGVLLAIDYANGNADSLASPASSSPEVSRASTSASASTSPSPSLSESTSPSPTLAVEKATPITSPTSPSYIPSPSATISHIVTAAPKPTRPTPTPTHTETKQPAANCAPNENAPGEIVCHKPVPAYVSAVSNDVEFEITGGAAVDCSQQEAGRVFVSISNDKGWANRAAIGNPC